MRGCTGSIRRLGLLATVALSVAGVGAGGAVDADQHHHHQHHVTASGGVVMNANRDVLPNGCPAVSEDIALTIHAGRRYAAAVPGAVFGMSLHEVRVPRCSRLTVTLVNEDQVRHQWMIHGLPKYLYPAGMFHVEAQGGRQQTGTFIVPAEHRTYLIHCDMAQHMEKGMRGQLVVGMGSGDLWAVPGVSDPFRADMYLSGPGRTATLLAIGLLLGAAVGWLLQRRHRQREDR